MKKAIRTASVLASALAALVTATSAQAYIWTGDDTTYIVNHTGGCVRAYVEGGIIDVPPHTTSYHFQVSLDTYYLVSVFPTPFCGNHAVHSIWFGGGYSPWTVSH